MTRDEFDVVGGDRAEAGSSAPGRELPMRVGAPSAGHQLALYARCTCGDTGRVACDCAHLVWLEGGPSCLRCADTLTIGCPDCRALPAVRRRVLPPLPF